MKIVIIGNGMVGHKFCEKLLAKKNLPKPHITIFGEEVRHAYDRVHLSGYFAGKSGDDLQLTHKDWYAENGIQLHLGDPIHSIDRSAKTIQSFKGIKEEYDILVMATGSAAMVPPIHGIEKNGVFVYRTIEDLDMIQSYAKNAKKAAVLGGGLLGLEAAKAMLDLGMKKHMLSNLLPG